MIFHLLVTVKNVYVLNLKDLVNSNCCLIVEKDEEKMNLRYKKLRHQYYDHTQIFKIRIC